MNSIFKKLIKKSWYISSNKSKSFFEKSNQFNIIKIESSKRHINNINRYYEVNNSLSRFFINFTENLVEFKININNVEIAKKAFPYIWLRENCKCAKCFNYKTKEVDLDLLKLKIDLKPETIENDSNHKVVVKWSDSHKSEYNLLELAKYALKNEINGQSTIPKVYWNREILSKKIKGFEKLNYKDYLTDSSSFQRALKSIYQLGAVIIDGVPNNPNEIEKICKPIGAIQPTVFGDTFCVVKNNTNEFSDRAYTDLSLRAHTDNVYLKNNSGLECFHVIQRPKQGGDSLLIDGFFCAEFLKKHHIDDFNFLSNTLVEFEFSDESKFCYKYFDKHITQNKFNNELNQIKMNPYHKTNVCHLESDEVKRYYQALQKFQKIIRDPDNEYWINLKEDQVLIFDNFRLLHGRSKINGSRMLVTAYLSRDDYVSKLNVHLNINEF